MIQTDERDEGERRVQPPSSRLESNPFDQVPELNSSDHVLRFLEASSNALASHSSMRGREGRDAGFTAPGAAGHMLGSNQVISKIAAMSSELLSTQRIFEGVSEDTLEKLSRSGRTMVLQQGEVLIEEGDTVKSIYCILKGEVDILVPDDLEEYEDLTWINMLVDGECIGEYSFVDHQPASATVRANTEVQLFELSHDDLRRLLDDDNELRAQIYKNLLESLVERLRSTNIYIDYLQRNKSDR